jgi:hypothetical protein
MNAVPSQIPDIGTVENCVVEFEGIPAISPAGRICIRAGRRRQQRR